MNNPGINRVIGPLNLFAAFTLAGTSVVAAQLVSDQLGTFTIAAVSLLFSVLGLLPFCLPRLIQQTRRLNLRDWLVLLLQAVCGIFLFRLFMLQGLLRTSTGEAGILTGTVPAITALLAWLWLKEKISRPGLFGILSTVAGVLLIQGLLVPDNRFTVEHMLGNALVLCAAVSESVFSVFSRTTVINSSARRTAPLDPVAKTLLVSLLAFGLCLVPAFFEQPLYSLAAIGVQEWLSLAWYGLIVTALGFFCWYVGIAHCRAQVAAAFSGMMPFAALLLSWLLLGERYAWQQWSGGFLVILGMLLIGIFQSADQPVGSG